MKLDGIAMITRVVVWQRGYFRHKQGNTSCIVIVDLKFHTKRRRAINEYDWREREETQIDISFKPGTQVFIPGTATPIPCKGIYFTVKRKKRLWSESKYDWGDQVAMIMKNLFEGSNLLIMKNGSIKKLY